MSTLVSLDSMLILGQGSPWKGQQNSDVKHQVNHLERCKGDVRERIINLSLGSPNRNTDLTSGNSDTRPLLPLKASGRLGNSGAAGKASELSVMFKENFNLCKILGLLVINFERHSFVTRGVLQASNVHLETIRPNQRLNILPGLSYMHLSEITPSRCGALRPSVCEALSYWPTFPNEMCRASDE